MERLHRYNPVLIPVMPRPGIVPIADITYCAAGLTLTHSLRYIDCVFSLPLISPS